MNKKSFLSVYKIISILLPVTAVVIAVTYFLAMKFDFDYDISHFATDSPAFWIFAVTSGIAAAASALATFLSSKKLTVEKTPAPTPISLFGAILSIIMCAGIFITEIRSGTGESSTVSSMQICGSVLVLFIGAAIALYCIDSQRGKLLHKVACIFAPISVNLTMFACYFDFEQPLNGPVRNITTMIQCAVLLFLLSEARLAFGTKTGRITPAFYIFSTAVTVSIALGFSLGGLLFKIFSLTENDPNPSFLRLELYFAIACIAVDRLLATPKIIGEKIETDAADTEADKE